MDGLLLVAVLMIVILFVVIFRQASYLEDEVVLLRRKLQGIVDPTGVHLVWNDETSVWERKL
jgi:hypothetical protein